MLKKYATLLIVTALLVGVFSSSVLAIPVGCRGGVSGTPVPGTVCPDGSIPVSDDSLPIECPGSSATGPTSSDYTVVCPTRPGRSACTYTKATGKCTATTSSTTDTVGADGQKIYDVLLQIINVLSGLVGVIVVVSIIYGGILYTTAGGDSQKVAKAKARIVQAVFAFIVYLFIYAFLQYIVPGGVF